MVRRLTTDSHCAHRPMSIHVMSHQVIFNFGGDMSKEKVPVLPTGLGPALAGCAEAARLLCTE